VVVTVPKDWTTVEVKSVIPHREPFLFVDRIVQCEPGVSISASFYVDQRLPVFNGHFPGNPIFPGVYLIEAVAQATALAVMLSPEYADYQPFLHKVEGFKFPNKVCPRDCLMIMVDDIEIHTRDNLIKGRLIENGLIIGKATGQIDKNERESVAIGTIHFCGIKGV